MSGKRKKDDSEAVSIMKFFKSTKRNRLSSKEPSDIAERSSISSATESVQINESTCSAKAYSGTLSRLKLPKVALGRL